MGARNFGRDLTELVSPLRAKAKDRNDSRSYIGHYRDQVWHVPLWVLVNNLTFGCAEHFFDLMRPGEQARVCRDNVAMTGHLGDGDIGYLHPRRARVCIYAMVKYRNLCAHDERLYCACVGRRRDVNYGGSWTACFPSSVAKAMVSSSMSSHRC